MNTIKMGDCFLTEQVMTHTFLGFCLSQLCMFLHTANKLWRLGAWREGQLHSETWRGVGAGNKKGEEEWETEKQTQAEGKGKEEAESKWDGNRKRPKTGRETGERKGEEAKEELVK